MANNILNVTTDVEGDECLSCNISGNIIQLYDNCIVITHKDGNISVMSIEEYLAFFEGLNAAALEVKKRHHLTQGEQ